ncbi:MAG: Rne/Rng family ribonuclease [Nitrospirae bacterium]|nr:Rne/Rng family ribonuclease [Nitrospirota bacterium]
MKKRILINALHAEEKRVAIVEGDTLVDFYVESSGKEHLKGNIYKGVVVRVEQGLQAAFVDFGPKKHGFLQLKEIMKENFQKQADEGRRVRIQDVLSKGQELIVQVEKDERDTKGASLTTFISIPGRYIVMMPGQDKVGVSRKIEGREDRERIKEVFNALKLPKGMGFILRTAGGDKTGEDLSHDLQYLTKLWSKIKAESKKAKAPALIYKEQDIAVRTVRDYLTSDVVEVLIDDPAAYKITNDFLKKTMPWQKINIKLYKDKKPIFLKHSIEEQISKIHERHVYLPSRGYLVIDKTEALTAIDVNSGRSRKEENIESTAFKTNMEAAEEAARQLRIRDIGGLIVIDFIDMESSKNRRELEKRLREVLATDKAHAEISGISKFGMVEMTRERLRPAYLETINKKCDKCDGTGIIKTDEMTAVSAFRSIHVRAAKGGVKTITCRLPVESLNYLLGNKHDELWDIEKEYRVRITLLADRTLYGQFVIDSEKTEAETQAKDQEQSGAEHKQHAKTQHHPHKDKKPAEHRHKPAAAVEEAPLPDTEAQDAEETIADIAAEGVIEETAIAAGVEAEEQKQQGPAQPKKKSRSRFWSRRRRPRKSGGGGTETAGGQEPQEGAGSQPVE